MNYQRNDRGYNNEPVKHRATCAKCNKSCEVPFKPNGRKPIYCSDCFVRDDNRSPRDRANNRGSSYGDRRSSDRPRPFSKPGLRPQTGGDNKEVVKQLKTIGIKIDKMIQLLMNLTKDIEEEIHDYGQDVEQENQSE